MPGGRLIESGPYAGDGASAREKTRALVDLS